MSAQLCHVVYRGGHGGPPSQRVVSECDGRPTIPRDRQWTPHPGLQLAPVLAASGSAQCQARVELVHCRHRIQLPATLRRQRKDLRHHGTVLQSSGISIILIILTLTLTLTLTLNPNTNPNSTTSTERSTSPWNRSTVVGYQHHPHHPHYYHHHHAHHHHRRRHYHRQSITLVVCINRVSVLYRF